MDLNITANSRCAVIGYGSWATAIAKVLSQKETLFDWYIRNPEVLESLSTESHNCRYLADVDFDMSRIHVSDDINEVVSNADIVFLIVPAAYLVSYLDDIKVPLNDKFIVSAIKGFIPGENQTVTQYLHKRYHLEDEQLGFITGPTHAEEVSHHRLTHLTVACSNLENAKAIGKKIQTNFMILNYSKEVLFLEYSAILKNIYSVAIGIAVGLGYGDNFIAVLVANCASEMATFLKDIADQDIHQIPSSFLGDLLVSCYSCHSRNRRLGVLIGRGNSVKSSLNEMTMVAEGYYASRFLGLIPEEKRKIIPIANMVYRILHEGLTARKAMKRLEPLLA